MASRVAKIPSLVQLKELFREAEAAAAAEAGEEGGASGVPTVVSAAAEPSPASSTAAPRSPQHLGLQPPSHRSETGASAEQRRQQPTQPLRPAHALSGRRSSSSGCSLLDKHSSGGIAAAPLPPLPLQEYGSRVSARLERRCLAARCMLDDLQAPMSGVAGGSQRPRLPSAALRFCQGLAFVRQRKAGLLGGWRWGDALVIQRLPGGSWSPPVFLRLRFASLGLTLGAQRVCSVYVLQTAEAAARFVRRSHAVALDAAMPGELDPTDVYAPMKPKKHRDLSVRPNASKPQCAAVSEGLMWDLSLSAGCTSVDQRLHSQVYGGELSPADVLAGQVVAPPELLPLYRDIELRAAEAQTVRRTTSKFEVARWQSIQHMDWSNRGTRPPLRKSSSTAGMLRKSSSSGGSASTSRDPSQHGASSWGAGSTSLGRLQAASLLRQASPHTVLGGPAVVPPAPAGSPSSLKLFGEVEVDFEELHSYEQQEAEDRQHQAAAPPGLPQASDASAAAVAAAAGGQVA